MAVMAMGISPAIAQEPGVYAPTGPVIGTPLPDLANPPGGSAPGSNGESAGTTALPTPLGEAGQARGREAAPASVGEAGPANVQPDDIQKLIDALPTPAAPATPGDAGRAIGEGAGAPVLNYRGQRLAPALTWRVENPFRFFSDPAAAEVHRGTFEALSDKERRNPVLAAERRLAARFSRGWAAEMVDDTCWNATLNKHRCDTRADYLTPRKHRIIATLSGVGEDGVECTWSVLPVGEKSVLSPETFVRPCSEPVKADIAYPEGSTVAVTIGGVEVVRTVIKVEDLLIVGMGDSFASGEGNPDVPVSFSRERAATYGDAKKEPTVGGYPARVGQWKQIGDAAFIERNARWLDQACHRSLYSHQLRAALQLAIEMPHRAVTYVGLACSGAEITDGLFLRYKGNEWVPNPPQLSQISAAAQAQCDKVRAPPQDLPEAYHIKGAVPELEGLVLLKCMAEKARKIDLLFVSIGGNDIGFARLLANAILSSQSTLRKLGGWFGQVYGQAMAERQLATLDERYKALNRALHYILHISWRESDRILLTGYPGMALLGDGSQVCPDGTAGMEVVSDFRLSSAKAREGIWVSDKLHRIMKQSAANYGWTFVEHHRRAFVDRGICAGFTDNAFSIADDLRLPRKVDGRWVPYNPADYAPYANRQRWFRTPNDAFMTGNFHVAPSILQKALKLKSLSFFQIILAAVYSGAFHPTAEGHAAIADAVVERSRAVLERYGQNGGSSYRRAAH